VHRDAQVDLDGDGRKDLLMLLEDRNWCGSGGCTLLVFHHGERGYDLVTRASPVQLPVAISPRVHSGWHDLLVGVGGGGTVAGTVALQFNGSGYPSNPTLLALLSPEALPPAQVVIDQAAERRSAAPH
jgi:putative lipoprotein